MTKIEEILKLKHKNTNIVKVSRVVVPLVDITSLLIVPLYSDSTSATTVCSLKYSLRNRENLKPLASY